MPLLQGSKDPVLPTLTCTRKNNWQVTRLIHYIQTIDQSFFMATDIGNWHIKKCLLFCVKIGKNMTTDIIVDK